MPPSSGDEDEGDDESTPPNGHHRTSRNDPSPTQHHHIASMCTPNFQLSQYLTCLNPRLLIKLVLHPTQSPKELSLHLFTPSLCINPVRREQDPVGSDSYGWPHRFSGPSTHPCPACYGPTNRSARPTSAQIPQVPVDDRRESRSTLPFGQEN